MAEPLYPMRINKYLAWKKYGTRRAGDKLVANKKVLINGRLATLGDKVNENDVVEVRTKEKAKTYLYLAYHKPLGVITHSPQGDEPDIKAVLGRSDVFPVGRLDKNSHGLIILTNDGRLTDRLLNPKYDHEKEYLVKTRDMLRPSFKKYLEAGVDIGEGIITKPCRVEMVDENSFRLTLTEGKKHQIRRMCSALHVEIKDLKRVRVMNIKLGTLPPGKARALAGGELAVFLKSLGL